MAQVASLLPFKPTYPGAQKYFFGPEEDGGLGHLPYDDKMTAPSKTHPQGQPQVDEETISRLAAEGLPHAKEFKRYAELRAANEKWYRAWAELTGPDGRLRTSYKQATVISGRLAVGRAQLQAIPQSYKIPEGLVPVRRFFVPKPGHQLWEVDVSQAEIRIATAVARCQPMLDQFLSGQDSHSAACWLMFRAVFEADGCATLQEAEQHPKWNEFRQVAKRCNLGILYGAGVNTIRTQLKLFTGIDYPQRQVREWVEGWRAAFPQFVRFLEAAARKAVTHGWVRLVNGRVRWFSAYEPTHKAANQIIQGSQAEVIKLVMNVVEAKYPGMLLLSIHDSVVLEIPDHLVEKVVADVERIMIAEFEKAFAKPWVPGGEVVTVPFAADSKQWEYANAA
jgi:DNA polymerase I-like protein with 3'-5' exonuclease and polymerase domains